MNYGEKKFYKGYIDAVFKAIFCNPKDEEFTKFLSREENVRKLTNTLLHHAKDDGIKEVQIEAARKLLENNVDINIIINSTGLSKKDIEKLHN